MFDPKDLYRDRTPPPPRPASRSDRPVLTARLYDDWLMAVAEPGVKLSEWETWFVAGLVGDRTRGSDLSGLQIECLRRIYNKRINRRRS